jgi:uncharacterized protein (DUF427 family)
MIPLLQLHLWRSFMPQATWNGVVIAESDDTVVVEGNHYFPRESLGATHFSASTTTSRCFWKGTANYLNVVVDGETNADAAWFYETPSPAASKIQGRVAFWKGVQVT